MIVILWCAAILQWLCYIYLPTVMIYGVIRMMAQQDVTATICSPFMGIKKVSMKSGFIIWMVRVMFLGVVLYDIGQWIRFGVNPLIRMW